MGTCGVTHIWASVVRYNRSAEGGVIRVIRGAGRHVHGWAVLRALAKGMALLVCLAANVSTPSSASAATPQSDDPWWDYQIIMWQPHTPEQYAALKKLGITGGDVIAKRRTTDRRLGARSDCQQPALVCRQHGDRFLFALSHAQLNCRVS